MCLSTEGVYKHFSMYSGNSSDGKGKASHAKDKESHTPHHQTVDNGWDFTEMGRVLAHLNKEINFHNVFAFSEDVTYCVVICLYRSYRRIVWAYLRVEHSYNSFKLLYILEVYWFILAIYYVIGSNSTVPNALTAPFSTLSGPGRIFTFSFGYD